MIVYFCAYSISYGPLCLGLKPDVNNLISKYIFVINVNTKDLGERKMSRIYIKMHVAYAILTKIYYHFNKLKTRKILNILLPVFLICVKQVKSRANRWIINDP